MKYYLAISLSVLLLEDTNIDSVVFIESPNIHLGLRGMDWLFMPTVSVCEECLTSQEVLVLLMY